MQNILRIGLPILAAAAGAVGYFMGVMDEQTAGILLTVGLGASFGPKALAFLKSQKPADKPKP